MSSTTNRILAYHDFLRTRLPLLTNAAHTLERRPEGKALAGQTRVFETMLRTHLDKEKPLLKDNSAASAVQWVAGGMLQDHVVLLAALAEVRESLESSRADEHVAHELALLSVHLHTVFGLEEELVARRLLADPFR